MPIPYKVLLVGQSWGNGSDGKTWSETRYYESSDPEAVGEELPAIGDAHPSIANLKVLTTSAESLDDTEQRVKAVITYGIPQATEQASPNEYGETWNWDMTAQQSHISSVPDEMGDVLEWDHFTNPSVPVDGQASIIRLIGLNGENDVAGVDVYRQTGALTVSRVYSSKAYITSSLRKTWFEMQATLNAAAWKDWGEEEILYLGPRIRLSATTATVDHQFLFGVTVATATLYIAPGNKDQFFMDSVQLSNVRPFDYVWQEPVTRLALSLDINQKYIKQLCPKNVKKGRLYRKTDFNALGLQGP